MAQQIYHRSKCIMHHIVWITVFSAILGSVYSCSITDRELGSITKDLERKIKTNDIGNEMRIIDLLISQNNSQLVQISRCYRECFKRDLIADLKHKFTGKLERIVVALVTPETQYYAKLIHSALVGVESDSCALIDILCIQNTKMDKLYNAYEKLFDSRLDNDLGRHTTGLFKRLLLALSKYRRYESWENNKMMADSDARDLERDDDIFRDEDSLKNSILVTGSFDRIRRAVYRYHEVYGKYYEKKITDKYNGDIKRALIAIVRWSKGKERYYAEKLHDSLYLHESDDDSLIRVIIWNREDMEPIKKEYERRYSIPLENDIGNKITGQYAKALIALINKKKDEKEESEESGDYSTETKKRGWCFWCL